MTVEKEKEFLKKWYLMLKEQVLSYFCKFCKTFLVFCTNAVTEVILNLLLTLYCTSYSETGIIGHYTEQIPVFGLRTYCKLDHNGYLGRQPEFERERSPNQKKGLHLYLATYWLLLLLLCI